MEGRPVWIVATEAPPPPSGADSRWGLAMDADED